MKEGKRDYGGEVSPESTGEKDFVVVRDRKPGIWERD